MVSNLVLRETNHRIEWADNARGIGAILLILAHTYLVNSWLGDYVDTFRTTLFFFIAGCFFSLNKYDNFNTFVKKKIQTILIPYFLFAVISFIFYLFRFGFGSNDYYKDLSLYQEFLGIFYSAGVTEWMDFNLTLWFWTCLFVVNIMFYFLKKKIRTKAQLITILILFSLAGYAEGLWNPYRLPWGIDIALSAIVFFGFGHILSSLLQSLLLKRVAVKTILIGLFFIPNLVLSDPLMNLNMKLHASYFDFYVEAFSGITFCILLSSIIHSKWLLYLGRNSLILTAAHIPMLKISKQLLVYAGFVSNHYAIEIVRAILTILLTLPLIYITQRFFPSIIGNSRRIPNQGAHLEPNLSLAGDSRR